MQPTILIVDDSPIIRDLLDIFMRKAGYRTMKAGNATEALKAMTEHTISLVVCDFHMPDINGIELSQLIRSRAMHGNVPILMLTSKNDPALQATAKQVGINAWMQKPFSNGRLQETIQRLLGLSASEPAERY